MFTKARLKLTAWYLLILMVITGTFSVLVYRNLMTEVGRSFRILRVVDPNQQLPNRPGFHSVTFFGTEPPLDAQADQQLFDEVRQQVAVRLLLGNGVILAIAGIASYFLAGLTLQPIEAMVNEQKRFVSDASHELRTPLTAMKTEIEVALREKKITNQEAKELLGSNLEEVDKMQTLTNYLLALNRYQNNQQHLPVETVNLKNILIKALGKTKPKAEAKEIVINSQLDEVRAKGNALSLEELFIIFLDNAIKYSHEKGKIKIKLTQEHTTAVVDFEDQGIGINEEDLPHIFDRFYRADHSRSKITADGYGLGLSIAKNIIDMHHGKVEVHSIVDKGSKFRIILPA